MTHDCPMPGEVSSWLVSSVSEKFKNSNPQLRQQEPTFLMMFFCVCILYLFDQITKSTRNDEPWEWGLQCQFFPDSTSLVKRRRKFGGFRLRPRCSPESHIYVCLLFLGKPSMEKRCEAPNHMIFIILFGSFSSRVIIPKPVATHAENSVQANP